MSGIDDLVLVTAFLSGEVDSLEDAAGLLAVVVCWHEPGVSVPGSEADWIALGVHEAEPWA